MTEKRKIMTAWWNVSSLAMTSDYCKESDHTDIELIESIVRKATPKKPEIISDQLVCPSCKNELKCGYAWCSSASGEQLIVRTSQDSNYCPYCGQAIKWSKGETE